MGRRYIPSIEKFNDRFIPETNSGCWLWTGTISNDGYGTFSDRRKSVRAHRFSWEYHCGPIPAGLGVLHRCDTPCCVNWRHLFLGTNADNVKDARSKGRHTKGEIQGSSILSELDVRIIRRLYESGMKQTQIGPLFGTDQTNVSLIVRRVRWNHI